MNESMDWDEFHGFVSPGEFDRFRRWIDEAVDQGVLVEVPVLDRYNGATIFDERWYRTAEGEVWRVVHPTSRSKAPSSA